MARPSLSPQLAQRILDHVRARGLSRGAHLPAQLLADTFQVSRGPVVAALEALAREGVVRSEPRRGFFLARGAAQLGHRRSSPPAPPDEEAYLALARDRLDGALPDRLSESALMRRYGIPRSRLLRILHRAADEGWIDRLPGNGWAFSPVLTSQAGYEQGYRFRAALESQALLQPGFRVDPHALVAARAEQQALLDGGYRRASVPELFRANAGFHELLVGWSGNDFFVDALRRVNRVRRLIEYRLTVDRDRLPAQCREHLHVLSLLEAGRRQEAARLLRLHVEGAGAIKVPLLG